MLPRAAASAALGLAGPCCCSSAALPQARALAVAAQRFRAPAAAGSSSGKGKQKRGEAEASPRMQAVLAMLAVPDAAAHVPLAAGDVQLEAEFVRHSAARKLAWWADMEAKHKLQKDALRALPPGLRALAEQPDLAPPPPNRVFMMATAPEAYRDP